MHFAPHLEHVTTPATPLHIPSATHHPSKRDPPPSDTQFGFLDDRDWGGTGTGNWEEERLAAEALVTHVNKLSPVPKMLIIVGDLVHNMPVIDYSVMLVLVVTYVGGVRTPHEPRRRWHLGTSTPTWVRRLTGLRATYSPLSCPTTPQPRLARSHPLRRTHALAQEGTDTKYTNPKWAKRQREDLVATFSKLSPNIPLVVLPGNHDVGNAPTVDSINGYVNYFGDDYFGASRRR